MATLTTSEFGDAPKTPAGVILSWTQFPVAWKLWLAKQKENCKNESFKHPKSSSWRPRGCCGPWDNRRVGGGAPSPVLAARAEWAVASPPCEENRSRFPSRSLPTLPLASLEVVQGCRELISSLSSTRKECNHHQKSKWVI